MEQSPSWEANWLSAGQEIPRILCGTRKFITVLTSATRHLSLSWANQKTQKNKDLSFSAAEDSDLIAGMIGVVSY